MSDGSRDTSSISPSGLGAGASGKPTLRSSAEKAIQKLEREGVNQASITADTEKVEAEIAHTAESWTVAAAFWRQWDRVWGASAKATKKW